MATSLVNAGLLSLTAPDYLTEEQVVVLENGTTLPEPAVLGNKCAAYRVWADVLQPIQSVGTAIQPACYAYDDADNMTMLKTFRAGAETISSNPSERTDADITTWEYHASTGLELRKTYADGTSVIKTYDAYNRLATETDARGNIKTHSYEHARGLHLSTSYTDNTLTRQFSYNHLGQIVQITDAAGTRTLGYNSYGEQETDSLLADGVTHLITENRDTYGRSIGYTYAKNGVVQQTVNTGYGTNGRISTAGFLHGGESKIFSYTYLPGSNLLQMLTKPNGMTQTYSYETSRDLLTHIAYHRGNTLVTQREYVYDTLGRPTSRSTARQGSVANDSFTHNTRSELTAATVNNVPYQYAYDNIGNRTTATEGADNTLYEANALNQYTSIQENEEPPFLPEFDADGNQTRLKTATGIWSAVYDAENRPTSFTNTASNTVVECAYDSMGRRSYKKVTVNGEVTLHQRYIYRGYLQIACCDLTRSNHPCLWLIMWDPTQPIATRPLAIQKDGTWYTYGLDLTKNVCEVFGTTGYIATTYTYSPYGEVTANGSVEQPIQWSSEFLDKETELVYYNYRYYEMLRGRWIYMDPYFKQSHLYRYSNNCPIHNFDILGLWCEKENARFDHDTVRDAYIKEIIFKHANLSMLDISIKTPIVYIEAQIQDYFNQEKRNFEFDIKVGENIFLKELMRRVVGKMLKAKDTATNNYKKYITIGTTYTKAIIALSADLCCCGNKRRECDCLVSNIEAKSYLEISFDLKGIIYDSINAESRDKMFSYMASKAVELINKGVKELHKKAKCK